MDVNVLIIAAIVAILFIAMVVWINIRYRKMLKGLTHEQLQAHYDELLDRFGW